jgi:hypothetical protein
VRHAILDLLGRSAASDGEGVYSVSFRVKDGYGKLSKVVGFSFNPGG